MTKLQVISSCLVRSSNDTPTPISRLDLTPWDLFSLLLNPIQRGLLFHKPPSRQAIHHLKTSLSRTLDFFPPLAGRLATVNNNNDNNNNVCFFVDCNNAGAEFVHAAAADVWVSDILGPTCVPELVSSFFPLNGVANFEGIRRPLLGVQVTELADGLFIACTANHTIVDGISFWHFFNCWSEISRGCAALSKPPVFERWFPVNVDRPIHFPPFDTNVSESQSGVPPPNLVNRIFNFSKEGLARLKSKANSEAKSDKISSLQALSAHLWRSYTRCRASDGNEEAGFMISIGARERIPLPEGYFGNAVVVARTAVDEAELVREGLGYAALKINQLVGEQSRERVVKLAQDWAENPVLLGKTGGFPFFMTSSPRHDVYGNDFGWGKPIGVRSGKATNFDGIITTFPAAGGGGGIEVQACLTPGTLQAMENDAEFMEAFTL